MELEAGLPVRPAPAQPGTQAWVGGATEAAPPAPRRSSPLLSPCLDAQPVAGTPHSLQPSNKEPPGPAKGWGAPPSGICWREQVLLHGKEVLTAESTPRETATNSLCPTQVAWTPEPHKENQKKELKTFSKTTPTP